MATCKDPLTISVNTCLTLSRYQILYTSD